MATEYKLSYTASEINEKLGKIDTLEQDVTSIKAGNLQQTPLFANSVDECVDTSNLYVLPDGYLYGYQMTTVMIGGYNDLENQLTSDGWASSSRISSSGAVETATGNAGYAVTSFIETGAITNSTIIRIKNSTLASQHRFCIYDANKNKLHADTNQTLMNNGSTTTDSNGITTITFSSLYNTQKTSCDNAKYIRFTVGDTANDVILTLNQEIIEPTESYQYSWANTGHKFISTPTDDPIIQDIIRDEVSAMQLKPEFANSIEECIDISKLYVLQDGFIYAYMECKNVDNTTSQPKYHNLADTTSSDWAIGKGISSTGTLDTNASGVVTNYIVAKPLDKIRFKNFSLFDGGRLAYYKADGTYIDVTSYSTVNTYGAYTVDTESGVATLVFGSTDGQTVHSMFTEAAQARFEMTMPIGEPIITVNEEIANNTTSDEEESTYAWQNTGHAFVPADYEEEIVTATEIANQNAEDIADLKSVDNDIKSRLEAIENNGIATNDGIPSYWDEHLTTKIAQIKALQDEGGKDCFSFIVITDIHYEGNAGKKSPLLAKRIMNECGIKYCLCLGDTQTRHGAKYDETYIENEWIEIEKMLSPIRDRLLMTQGNHDGSYYWFDLNSDGQINDDVNGDGVADTYDKDVYNYTPQKLYERIFRKVSTIDGVIFSSDGCGYYVDDKASRVRYIILNTHVNKWELNADGSMKYNNMYNFRYGQAQFDMVEEALNSIPSNDWVVIVASHVPLDRSGEFKAWGSNIEVIDGDNYRVQGEVDDSVIMAGVLNAYTNHDNYVNTSVGTQSDNFDKVVVDVDFSNAKGTLVGYFGGHTHIDHVLPKNYSWANSAISNCITITTRCDGNEGRSGDTRTEGTTTEQSFDVFTVNKKTRTINATKIGAGADREIGY